MSGVSRTVKIAYLSKYPIIEKSLEVCRKGKNQAKNCGACEKCVRTKLNFVAIVNLNPSCFKEKLEKSQNINIKWKNHAQKEELVSISNLAHKHTTSNEWLKVLDEQIIEN